MIPNEEIFEIRLLFEYLYKTNQILYKHGKKRVNAVNRVKAYSCLIREGLIETVNFINRESEEKLYTEDKSVVFCNRKEPDDETNT